jgi:hypothetical protein
MLQLGQAIDEIGIGHGVSAQTRDSGRRHEHKKKNSSHPATGAFEAAAPRASRQIPNGAPHLVISLRAGLVERQEDWLWMWSPPPRWPASRV